MNIANPCKALLVAGALFVSIGLRADGTIPIPYVESLPVTLKMEVDPRDSQGTVPIPGSFESDVKTSLTLRVDETNAISSLDAETLAIEREHCSAKQEIYEASGDVIVGSDYVYDVIALCAAKDRVGDHVLIAKHSSAGLIKLEGKFVKVGGKLKFDGYIEDRPDTGSSSPESGHSKPGSRVKITLSKQ